MDAEDTDTDSSPANDFLPKNSKTACFRVLSLVYAKLLVVICIAFLISEIITDNVPLYFYEVYFSYLYGGSILFLLYVFLYLLRGNNARGQDHEDDGGCCGRKGGNSAVEINLNGNGSPQHLSKEGRPLKMKTSDNDHSHGGFFLRIGAIAFGLGTMVYNGLKLGSFFEISPDSPCWNIMLAINPCLQATFTFMQMYFIFMNSRLNIHKFKVVARFGLMHIIGTNICVWIRTLTRESLRVFNEYSEATGTGRTEDFMILDPLSRLRRQISGDGEFGTGEGVATGQAASSLFTTTVPSATTTPAGGRGSLQRGLVASTSSANFDLAENVWLKNPATTQMMSTLAPTESIYVTRFENNFTCDREDVMGTIVKDASPYLFPLIIEYSLIGAVVLFVMWKNIGRCPRYVDEDVGNDRFSVASKKSPTKVDCIGISKGLFFGLLVVVTVTVCLVSFFVLVQQPDHHRLAIFLADTSHAGILVVMLLASIIGFIRSRKLKFSFEKPDDLDAILLRISGFGLFLYSVFCMLAGALSPLTQVSNILVLVTSALAIVQVLVQIIYISDVSKRSVHLAEHDRTKPGRQVVTFLLLCNLALWVVYTFEIDKVDANPVQLNFYGHLHWAVILRVTLPLAIFHRFHSAVVLADVWKSSYRGHE